MKYKRIYRACNNCRQKKIKCDLGSPDSPHDPPCARCKRESIHCMFGKHNSSGSLSPQKKPKHRGVLKKSAPNTTLPSNQGKRRKYSDYVTLPEMPNTSSSRQDVAFLQNTMDYLASAKAALDNEANVTNISTNGYFSRRGSQQKELSTMTNLNLSFEGLDKLKRLPLPKIQLSSFEYIGNGRLLLEEEARKLLELFFLKMHPFFPYIPLQLRNPEYLANFPILLIAILAISSRYFDFSELSVDRNYTPNHHIEVHEKLWIYCQRLMSQTIWAEASTRSIGTILAFLVFTEWNPRAIHSKWSDYANSADFQDIIKKPTSNSLLSTNDESFTVSGAIRRSDRMSWMLTGSSLRLAQETGFISISSKIFIAVHTADLCYSMNMNQQAALNSDSEFRGCIANSKNSLKNYDSSTVGDLKYDRNKFKEKVMKDETSRSLLKSIYNKTLLESNANGMEIRDKEMEFLDDEFALFYCGADADINADLCSFKELQFSNIQNAQYELLKILGLGYEAIYREQKYIKGLYCNISSGFAILDALSSLINNWKDKYRGLLSEFSLIDASSAERNEVDVLYHTGIMGETFISDYHYCQLYIYSFAFQTNVNGSDLTVNEMLKSANYVQMAYHAANEILESAKRVHKNGLLKFIPVRWVIRIIKSVAFIVKCYLTMISTNCEKSNHVMRHILRLGSIPFQNTVELLHQTAVLLQDAAPDELHLSRKHATLLMYLCNEIGNKLKSERLGSEVEQDHHDESDSGTSGYINDGEQIGHTDPVTYLDDSKAEGMSYVNGANLSSSETSLVNDESHRQLCPSLTEEVTDWFSATLDIGLNFVEPWADMIEQHYMKNGDLNDFESLQNQFNATQ